MTDTNESNVMEGDSESTSGDGDLYREANRVIAFLSQIVECLEETEMADMNEILLGVFEVSKENDSAETREKLMQLYSRFFEIVEFHSGISVKLIDQALRSFKMIAMDAEGLGNLVSEKYIEMILLEYPYLSIDMKLTPEMLRTYFRLLKKGYEEVCHIRLMVVGMFGVGKSTLVRRLCNRRIDDVDSTEGIDILTNSCEINDDDDWEISSKDERDRFFKERLQVLVNKYGKREKVRAGGSTSLPTGKSVSDQAAASSQFDVHDEDEDEHEHEEEKNRFAQHFIEENRKNDDKGIVAELIQADNESKIPKRKPTVSIWDFAGQSVYYSTHHFFLNDRSIYLVVLNLSKKLSDKAENQECWSHKKDLMIRQKTECFTCHDAFKFWMRSIYIYTERKQKEQNNAYQPKIILIGTHKDKLTDDILEGKTHDQYKEDYFNRALSCFEGRPVLDLVHEKKFLVANTCENEDFLEIKKEINKVARGSDFWPEKVPASFILLEKAVQETKDQKDVHVMYFESLAKANEDSVLPRPERKEIELFLTIQNAFGNILYYNHDLLGNMIILSPQWIIDIFKIFVTHKKDKTPKKLKKWEDFERYGKLENELLEELLERNNLSDAKAEVICYMEYLDVMVQPVEFISSTDGASGSMSQEENARLFFPQCYTRTQPMRDFYIMPCMLPARPTDNDLKELFTDSGIEQPPTLCMYIKKGFLPPFVVHCIIATCIKELPISKRKYKELLFSRLSEFELGTTARLLIWFVEDFLHFTVIFKDPADSDEKKMECCKNVKRCFEKLVLSVFNIHGKDTFDDSNKADLFEYLVKCPICPQHVPFQQANQSEPYMHEFIRVTDIKSSLKKICTICDKMVTVQKALGFWFDIEKHEPENVTLFAEDQFPTEDMLADFAYYVGGSLGKLRCKLLIDDNQFERISLNYTDHLIKVFHVLHFWMKRREGLKVLHKAMKESGCRIRDEVFDGIVNRKLSEQTEESVNNYMKGLDVTKFDECKQWDTVVNDLQSCIGEEYWILGIRLGISETELQKKKVDYPQVDYRIGSILREWKKLDKTLKDLITAMVKSECNMETVKAVLMRYYSSST